MNTILNCNQPAVYKIVKEIRPEKVTGFHQFLEDDWEKTLKIYEENNFSITSFLYDRSGNIKHFLRVNKDAYPIPKAGNFNLSLYDVIFKRAREILALGKPINVCWSGGIDSTFVLLCLLDLANDKSQIKVYCSDNSKIGRAHV